MRIDNPKITAVIITDDNINVIKAIDSVYESCFEIVLINTVKTEKVKELLINYTKVRYFYFKWCDDFSKARNFGIKKAKGDWILTIDSDEELKTPIKFIDDRFIAYQTIQSSKGLSGKDNLPTARLFKNQGIYYRNKIHETIDHAITPENSCNSDILIEHSGYEITPEDMKKKFDRNHKILLNDKKNVIYNYHMGNHYADKKDFDTALKYYSKAMKDRLNDSHFAIIQNNIHTCYLLIGNTPLRTLLKILKQSLVFEPFQMYARANIVEHLLSVINDDTKEMFVQEIKSELGKVERIWENKLSNLLYNELNVDEEYINKKYEELQKWDNTIKRIAI